MNLFFFFASYTLLEALDLVTQVMSQSDQNAINDFLVAKPTINVQSFLSVILLLFDPVAHFLLKMFSLIFKTSFSVCSQSISGYSFLVSMAISNKGWHGPDLSTEPSCYLPYLLGFPCSHNWWFTEHSRLMYLSDGQHLPLLILYVLGPRNIQNYFDYFSLNSYNCFFSSLSQFSGKIFII